MAQSSFVITAVILLLLGVGLFFIGRRFGFRGSFLGVLLVFVAVLALSAQPVSAQSTNCPSTASEPGISLQLINDTQTGQVGGTVYVPVVANDLFPNADLIDWYSLDLIPETPEVDTTTNIYHPNDGTFVCGYAYFEYGVSNGENVEVTINSDCQDDLLNSLALVSPLTFQYTARTQAGILAPAPATVTITLDGVTAFDHTITLSGGNLSSGANVASNAATFVGTINSDSVDLDPSTPGRQTTITITDIATPDVDLTLEVDSSGLVTATLSSSGDLACSDTGLGTYPYTIQNSANTVSNEALISVFYDDNCG